MKRLIDPHLEQEKTKYTQPIASREFILSHLQKLKGRATYQKLVKVLQIKTAEQKKALKYRLTAMLRDKQLSEISEVYYLMSETPKMEGVVSMQKDGTGLLTSDNEQNRWFLSYKQMRQVMAGDRISATLCYIDNKKRHYGQIDHIVKKASTLIVGQYWSHENGQDGYIVPFVRNHELKITALHAASPQSGSFVLAELLKGPDQTYPPEARLMEILGDHADVSGLIKAVKHQHAIPSEWPQPVLQQLNTLDKPTEADIKQRFDYRNLPFITIDGETAKDFDDAVYCCKITGDLWRLQVAIADVSHYVAVNSALDQEAQQRGNSVYFPSSVEPMLPQKLSNDLCSLKPMQDRLVMLCTMTLNQQGKILDYHFSEGVIRSRYRLTYNEVAAMLEDTKHTGAQLISVLKKQYPGVWESIQNLHLLYQLLYQARSERGALDFRTKETFILFGKDNQIKSVLLLARNVAHKIIEESMLAANYCAADFLEKSALPAVYRVHEEASGQKLSTLQEAMKELNLAFNNKQTLQQNYKRIIEKTKDQPNAHLIEMFLLRSLPQAYYSPSNHGHFGLVYDKYTHFTSPIRRYADLLVHRAIKYCIRSADTRENLQSCIKKTTSASAISQQTLYPYKAKELKAITEHISLMERRADEAARTTTNILKCRYLKNKVGEKFAGIIVGVTNFGFFVELTDLFVEGLVHINSLKSDYFHFSYAKQELQGERTGLIYKLGDSVKVHLVRVDAEQQEVDLILC